MPGSKTERRDAVDRDLRRSVLAHYERQLEEHGATARGMDWKDEASQRLRFRVLCDVCELDGLSVHEIGAGAGHLVDYLVERGVDAHYSGSDLSLHMVEAASQLHPGVSFEQRDAFAGDADALHDVVICSGLFHVKLAASDDEWRGFVERALTRMFAMCRVAIAFNLMTDQVDYRTPDLYHSNPGQMIDFCRERLSRYVTLRHDYPLHEYTLYVHRQSPVA